MSPANNSLQRTARCADADAERSAAYRMRYRFRSIKVSMATLSFLFAFYESTYACSCAEPQGLLSDQIKRNVESSSAVFTGTVVNIRKEGDTTFATFKVDESWKGIRVGQVTLSGRIYGGSCDYVFRSNERYLVYADGPLNNLQASGCSRTAPRERALKDLIILGRSWIETPPIAPAEPSFMPYYISILAITFAIGCGIYFIRKKVNAA